MVPTSINSWWPYIYLYSVILIFEPNCRTKCPICFWSSNLWNFFGLTTVKFIRSNRKWTFLKYVFLLFKKLRHRIFTITVHFIHIHKKFQSLNKRNSTTITYDWKIVLDSLIGSIDMLACFTSSRQSTPNVDLWEWRI